MQFTHLPGNKATPLLVLLACYIGVVCAGAIPTNYNRHDNDPRSPPSATDTHTNLDRTSATTGHEVEVPKSQQRTLSVKGKRTHEMPAEVADWFQDNGTEANNV
ncbi:uncharacterized protein LOC119738872 [Patiria miniata]|uniref:Uncharacterized protein n=1 Tax=Patiria miniata TaxID=46514 RepID=A0A914B1V2_PATMI|nr:uncharacterized protein LOC119738872 [Patiria miniata]XP_038069775.1 uncharacterized protein LOC119738872 [Patiria miniata]